MHYLPTESTSLLVLLIFGVSRPCLVLASASWAQRASPAAFFFPQQVPSAKPSAELKAALVPGHGLSPVLRSLSSSCQCPAAATQLRPAPRTGWRTAELMLVQRFGQGHVHPCWRSPSLMHLCLSVEYPLFRRDRAMHIKQNWLQTDRRVQ